MSERGRTRQKARTRAALLEAARELLAAGRTPNVEEAAEAAGVSRATAFRYFPNRRALLVAAHPEIEATELLGQDALDDPQERLDRTIAELIRLTIDNEPELRTTLRLSLEPGPEQELLLRQGRAIGWIEEALAPALRPTGAVGAPPPSPCHPRGLRDRGARLADRCGRENRLVP